MVLNEKHAIIKEAVGALVENSLNAGAKKVTSKVEDENGKYTVFVKDDGHGMNEETKEKVKNLLEKKEEKKDSSSSLEQLVNYINDFHLATREGAGTEITISIK